MNSVSRRTVVKGIAAGIPVAAWMSTPFSRNALAAYAESVEITTEGGRQVKGVLAVPDMTPAPVVMLIHEWWGMNEQIVSVADNFAYMGFLTLAIDLYGGKVATDAETATKYMRAMDAEAGTDIVKSWLKWLKGHTMNSGKVGTVGFCFGGGWSLNASLAEPVDATVVYYGDVKKTADQLSKLRGPVLGHFATQDPRINKEMVSGFEAEMNKAGKRLTSHWYEAKHAFTNAEGGNYDKSATQESWERTMAFLQENLGPPGFEAGGY